jgi:TerC family integral membrane protein
VPGVVHGGSLLTPIVSSQVLWMGLLTLLVIALGIDLWVHRRPRRVGVAEAAWWTAGWVALGLGCSLAIWLLLGSNAFLQFLASYAVEWSLSVDNVFVFVVIVASLAVPVRLRYVVLFFGSLGAIVLRLTFILAGTALLHRFEWLTYVFGVALLFAAWRFMREPLSEEPEQATEPGTSRLLRRVLPLSPTYDGSRLTTVANGRRLATPLLLALLLIAVTDLVFATDSVPAVFGMTRDPFLAFGSNALAVIGLRSTYFLLETLMFRFRYLKPALVMLLAFIGLKMLYDPFPLPDVPVVLSLAAIVAILGSAAVASWMVPPPQPLRNR